MVLAFCTCSDGLLSMYQVSFNSFLILLELVPDKLYIAKMKKGSNSVNTIDRAKVPVLCTFADTPL